ncbi:MAG: ROK family protein, partial [Carnobacterium sp.]
EGYQCTCGKKGCLETVASATGVVRLARDYADKYAGESKLKAVIDDGQLVTAKDIFDYAKQNDELAVLVIDKVAFYLGLACGNIANILNPSTIVIGG